MPFHIPEGYVYKYSNRARGASSVITSLPVKSTVSDVYRFTAPFKKQSWFPFT